MDFIDLATATESTTRTFLRRLATSTASAAAAASSASSINEDDDFANLAPPGEHEATEAAAAAAADYETGGLYGEAPGRPQYNFDPYDDGAPTGGSGSPLLSPSAEAELYLLATNFLLYVAMVIITTMVCKIYFPESLERAAAGPETSTSYNARSVSFVRKEQGGGDWFGDYSSDADDSDASENELEGEGGDGADDEEEESGSSSGGGGDDSNDEAGEDDDEEDRETEGLLEMEHDPHPTGHGGGSSHRRGKSAKAKRGGGNNKYSRSGSSGSFFLEFDQSTTSKSDVMKRLAFCVLMLNVTFVTWGVLQERMLTRRYPRITGEYFTYSYALVFTNRFWTLLFSGALLLYLKPRMSHSTVIYEYSFPSISNMLSSWCQYEALQYVSFPATTLFKSFKLAPVMAMGKILGNKEYPQYDYVVALVIGVGITMFMSASDDLHFGYDIHGQQASATWTGIMLLFFFLFFDSFTSQWQSRMFQRHRDLSMIELMFATSAFSTVLSFITLVHTKELGPALSFVYRHSEIHLHFLLFSICSTIGQLFIFYTIKNFGAVVFTIIMTTRVLLSIALSCILYGHEVGSTGFLGLMVVMGAVCYRIKRKAEGKQLVKWQGMGDEKAMELVQEWHEHADM